MNHDKAYVEVRAGLAHRLHQKEMSIMSHVLHELADELPEYKERIHDLKVNDAHFARLFGDYHDVNREIHRAESAGLNIADEHHEELKRKRLHLKDELFEMLQA